MLRNASRQLLVAGAAIALLGAGGTAQAQLWGAKRPCNNCPSSPVPTLMPAPAATAGVPTTAPLTPPAPTQNDPTLAVAALAGAGGVAADRDDGGNNRPFFQGDFLPGRYSVQNGHRGSSGSSRGSSSSSETAPGNAVGRYKASEFNSPIPTDRVFVNYGFFSRAASAAGIDVQNITPGVEKTFFDGWTSLDVRVPFASTYGNAQSFDDNGNLSNSRATILGNVSVAGKVLIYRDSTWALGGGLGFQLPTAANTTFSSGGFESKVVNRMMHVQPFIGALWTPNDRLWSQSIMLVDFIATSNPVEVNGTKVDDSRDAHLFAIDWQGGYKLFVDSNPDALFSFVAPYVELHYNQAFAKGIASGDAANTNLNFVAGVMTGIGQRGQLMIGGGVPISPLAGKPFDYEFGVRLGYFFGPSARRVPTTY